MKVRQGIQLPNHDPLHFGEIHDVCCARAGVLYRALRCRRIEPLCRADALFRRAGARSERINGGGLGRELEVSRDGRILSGTLELRDASSAGAEIERCPCEEEKDQGQDEEW